MYSYKQTTHGWILFPSFFGHWPMDFLNDQKKLGQFGHSVWKYRAMHIVMATVNSIMGQMTEMSQWKKMDMWYIQNKIHLDREVTLLSVCWHQVI